MNKLDEYIGLDQTYQKIYECCKAFPSNWKFNGGIDDLKVPIGILPIKEADWHLERIPVKLRKMIKHWYVVDSDITPTTPLVSQWKAYLDTKDGNTFCNTVYFGYDLNNGKMLSIIIRTYKGEKLINISCSVNKVKFSRIKQWTIKLRKFLGDVFDYHLDVILMVVFLGVLLSISFGIYQRVSENMKKETKTIADRYAEIVIEESKRLGEPQSNIQ